MTIPKKVQKEIKSFLQESYGFTVKSFFENVSQDIVNCNEAIINIIKKPIIGKKGEYNYQLISKNISTTKMFFKSDIVDQFVLKYIKEINRINYIVLNTYGQNVSQIKISDLCLTAFSGPVDDFKSTYTPTLGFWLLTSGGVKLAYISVKSDMTVTFQDKIIPIENFNDALINEYCRHLATIDEYFERDSCEKSYETRVDELQDILIIKQMVDI